MEQQFGIGLIISSFALIIVNLWMMILRLEYTICITGNLHSYFNEIFAWKPNWFSNKVTFIHP